MSRKDKYFSLLRDVADGTEPVRRMRHSAMLVIGNEIIAIGNNQYKSHPLQKRFGKTDDCIYLHAEIACIVNALRRYGAEELRRADMYLLKLNNRGKIGNSKPCPGCSEAIAYFGIRQVIHS